MMTDEAQPPTSSSSDANIPPPEPDPPPNAARMSSSSSSQAPQPKLARSRAQSSGTSEDNQSSSPNSSSTPPWLRWSRGLAFLLDDPQGSDLFEKYLDQEGCSAQLNFLWACEGLKCTASEDPPKIPQLVRSIHRHFFQNTTLLGTSDTTRSDLAQAIKEGRYSEVGLFDKAEQEVQTHMQNNLYPNFLKSEIYLCAVNGEEEEASNLQEQLELPHSETSPTSKKSVLGDGSSLGGEETKASFATPLEVDVDQKSCNTSGGGQSPKIPSPPLSTAPSVLLPNQLQTVLEDKELTVNSQQGRNSKLKLGLTKEALHFTQTQRMRVVPPVVATSSKSRSREGFTSHYHQKPSSSSTTTPLHPYHASYSSYNPVSRVDSEIQSMSSDAMTEDGTHSGHGHCGGRKHGAHSHRSKGQMSASSSHLHHPHHHPHSSDSSRRQLVCADGSVNNRDNLPFDMSCRPGMPGGLRDLTSNKKPLPAEEFAKLLIEKLEEVQRKREIDEKLSQRLSECDDHVVVPNPVGAGGGGGGVEQITPNVLAAAINRLQVQDEGLPDDILDQHMSRVFNDTPDNRSPKPRSPTAGRKRGGPIVPPTRPRRERDLVSTFSGDSGNVHDLYPSDTLPSTMPKSRSIPSELKLHDHGDFSGLGASQRLRFNRGGGFGYTDSRNVPLALMTRKTSSEFIDSGISVVSGGTPTILSTNQPAPSLPCDRTDLRVAQWIAHDAAGGDDRSRPRSTTSPPMMRRQKKPSIPPHASMHMPPMGQPTHLAEEVRKRLMAGKKAGGIPTAVLTSQTPLVPVGPSSSSSATVIPPRHHSPPSSDESSATTKEFISSFVFYEDNEQPYLVKIPCKLPTSKQPTSSASAAGGITLAMFKEHLPKRGNFRYFFKRECAEVYTNVVQEEIIDDLQELPLYDGKIICCLRAPVGTPSTSGTSI